MNKLTFIIKYLMYFIKAKTKHGVHPPFLYQFVTEVVNDKRRHFEYFVAETSRTKLLNNNKEIYCEDFGTGKSGIRKISDIAKKSAKPKKYTEFLFRVVRAANPATIIELGTSLGVSTSYLSLSCPNARIISIEGSKTIGIVAKKSFVKNNLTNIHVVNEKIEDSLQGILEEVTKVDVIFFDANHRKEATINYFEQCLPYHHNDTVFIFDDIHWSSGMEEAWNYIIKHPEVKLSLDMFFMGIVYFKKELTKENFLIRF